MNLKISFLWIKPQCLLLMIALETHVGGFGNQQINFLARAVVGRGLVEVAIQTRGGGDAAGVLVEVDMHHAVFAGGHLPLFFGITAATDPSAAPNRGTHRCC
jgi:hypothetical protein